MKQMRPVFRLLSLILVSGVVFGLALQPVSTAANPFEDKMILRPAWTSGIIADNAGKAGFVVDDLNQDGITDIATCSNGYAYVLNQISENDYATVWYSEYLGCNSIAAGDANNDGIQELFIGSTAGEIFSFPSDDYSSNAPIVLPVSAVINAIAATDVDADGQVEIVAATTAATYVFDAFTTALEWNASGYGGTQVAIGNIDATPLPEIVVNSNPGHVLNAAAKIQKWAYAGGFGREMDIGDVDSDGMEEIAFYTSVYGVHDLYVYNADDQTMALELLDMVRNKDAILVHDVDGDGFAEVLLSDDQWGNIDAYRVSDGSRLWQITDRDHGVTNLAVGDANNDGINDVLYGTGMTSTGADYLMIADWRKINPTWVSQDLDPPLYSQAADIDGDGEFEIVTLSNSSDSGYSPPILQIYSTQSNQLKGSLLFQTQLSEAISLGIGQLDTDPGVEIVALLEQYSDTRLEVIDGLTLSTQWASPVLAEETPRGMLIQNLDAETGQDEIILTSGEKEVWVLNGASNILRWQSGTLDGVILDLAAGDLNADGLPELAVLTKTSLYVYDTATWDLLYHPLISNGAQVAIAGGGLTNPGTLLVSSGTSSTQTIQARSGGNFALRWQHTVPSVILKNILIDDFNQDGREEFALVGIQNSTTLTNPSLLTICSLLDPTDCLYQMNDRRLGIINNLQVGDLDADGRNELLINSANLIQIDDIRVPSYLFIPWAMYFVPTPTATPTETPSLAPTQAETATETLTPTCCTLTPNGSETATESSTETAAETPTETAAATEMATSTRTSTITRTPQPTGTYAGPPTGTITPTGTRTRTPTATPYPDFKPARIYGTVTFGGVPIAGIPLELVFTDGTTQTSVTTTLSGEDGSYSFTDIPTLTGGLAYQVIAPNPEDNPDYLERWETRKLYTAQPDEEVHLGEFDVKDVELLLPENGAQINVPYTFTWQHPAIVASTDQLMFFSADGQTFLLTYYTMSSGNSNIRTIPAALSVGEVYTWKINPRMADGSQGISNAYRSVVFNNTNLTPTITRLGTNE